MSLIKRVILVLLVLFFFSSLTKNFLSYRRSLAFYQTFKQQYDEEKKKNNELKMLAVKTKDPYELEKTIRNKLNYTKPGEEMVIVPDPTPEPTVITPTPQPVYRQWWSTFFKTQ